MLIRSIRGEIQTDDLTRMEALKNLIWKSGTREEAPIPAAKITLPSLFFPDFLRSTFFQRHFSEAPSRLKTIHVQYFAILREQRGLAQEKIATTAATAADLYAELYARHGFMLTPAHLRIAVNEEFAPWAVPLHDGDAVVFIPPVAGG